ncbi:MAG TPA: hypothetical protein VGN26_03070 [Armatimonadota bacterium]
MAFEWGEGWLPAEELVRRVETLSATEPQAIVCLPVRSIDGAPQSPAGLLAGAQ